MLVYSPILTLVSILFAILPLIASLIVGGKLSYYEEKEPRGEYVLVIEGKSEEKETKIVSDVYSHEEDFLNKLKNLNNNLK